MSAPLLVLAWGNRSRGDDALGPLLLQAVQNGLSDGELAQIDFLEDFQLQVEHALDLIGRRQVLLVDASAACHPPFEVVPVQAAHDASLASHVLSPSALLAVFVALYGAPPPCTLLAIRGTRFNLGADLSASALANLQAASRWALEFVGDAVGT